MKQRWRKFVKAFFKKIEKEGTSNMSTEWLEFAELILSNEMSHEKTSGYQKEMESLQFDCR